MTTVSTKIQVPPEKILKHPKKLRKVNVRATVDGRNPAIHPGCKKNIEETQRE